MMNKYKYYDVHAHINIEPLIKDDDKIILECEQKKVIFNNIGTNIETSSIAILQAKKNSNVRAFIGIHPSDTNLVTIDKDIKQIEDLYLNNRDVVFGIGETGLDYHYSSTDKISQKQSFIEHIKIANKYNLPLMVHIRDAYDDCFDILKQFVSEKVKIIIHCFSSNKDQVLKFKKLNCYFSIPGIISFKNAFDLKEAVSYIPKDRLLVETDSPFLSPVPYRGETNYPYRIIDVMTSLCEVLNIEFNELSNLTFQNAMKCFNKY